MINRPSELFPKELTEEFRRLANSPSPAAELRMLDKPNFECRWLKDTWLRRFAVSGADIAGMIAMVNWIKEGPKIARATEEQFQALSQVEVRMELKDFSMPYPSVLVDMPPGHLHKAALLHRYSPEVLICNSVSYDNQNDVCTVIRQTPGEEMEVSLGRYYDSITEDESQQTQRALRVACNLMLVMTSYGCKTAPVFPHEVVRDQKLAKEDTERGAKARQRLKEVPYEVKLDREVVLYHRETKQREPGEPTGKEMPTHWRRGSWVSQPHGPKNSLRKLVFRHPVLVRADKFAGDTSQLTTVYREATPKSSAE